MNHILEGVIASQIKQITDEMELITDDDGMTYERPITKPIKGSEYPIDVIKNTDWLAQSKLESCKFGEIALKNILTTWPTRNELVTLLLEDFHDDPNREAIEKKMNNLLPCPLQLIKNLPTF